MSVRHGQVDLLQRWHAGDQDALNILVERDLEWIRTYVHRRMGALLRRKAETNDIVQETLLRAFRYGPRLLVAGHGQFRALIGRIVDNVLRDQIDHFQAIRREARREHPLAPDSVLSLDLPVASVERPSEAVLRGEMRQWIRPALELLDPDDRRVILLRLWEDLAFAEIAARMGISE